MTKIRDIVKQEIPFDFFVEWNKGLQYAYILAEDHVKGRGLEQPRIKNLLPYTYTQHVEQKLKEIAGKFSCFEIEEVKTETGYNFIILRTDSIILTQKSIGSSGSLVEPSIYRTSLARGNSIYCDNSTGYLFPLDPMKSDNTKEKIYGILTHNRASVFTKEGQIFSNLAFPDPSFDSYIDNIDLFEWCKSAGYIESADRVIDEAVVAEIQEKVIPRLKKASKAEEM